MIESGHVAAVVVVVVIVVVLFFERWNLSWFSWTCEREPDSANYMVV